MITGKFITRAASSSLATRTTSEFFAISAQLLSLSVGLTPVIEKGRDPLDSVRVSDKSSFDENPPSVPRETEKRKKNSGHRGGGESSRSWFRWEQDSVCRPAYFGKYERVSCIDEPPDVAPMVLKDEGDYDTRQNSLLLLFTPCIVSLPFLLYFCFFILYGMCSMFFCISSFVKGVDAASFYRLWDLCDKVEL